MIKIKKHSHDINLFLLIYLVNFLFLTFSEYLNLDNIKNDFKNTLRIDNVNENYILVIIPLLISGLFLIVYKLIEIEWTLPLIGVLNLSIISIFLATLRIIGFSRLFLVLNIIFVPLIIVFLIESYKNLQFLILVFLSVLSVFFTFTMFFEEPTIIGVSDVEETNANLAFFESVYIDTLPSNKDKVTNFSEFTPHLIEINSLDNKYILERYSICCREYNSSKSGPPVRQKSVGYISVYEDLVFYLTGTGEIFYFNGKEIEDKSINFKFLDSNFININKNKNVINSGINFEGSWESTKDLMIIENNIYLSYVNEPTKNCVNTEILVAEINLEYLEFESFFEDKECIERPPLNDRKLRPYNGHLAGGKMLYVPDKQSVLFSRGAFRDYTKAQDKESLFGKLILINIETKDITIPAMGTRNPQGLALTKDGRYVLETEHGPNGGDEINRIDLNKEYENYGWPLSSYGDHWDKDYYDIHAETAPLNKSHDDYGFIEPLIYFIQYPGGHGISDIDQNLFSNENRYFVATMNAKRLYDIKFNEDYTSYDEIISYGLGERIRDIEFYPNGNLYFLILETTPTLGVLKSK
jgi:hypothetical protein